jgi:hypothetical protein
LTQAASFALKKYVKEYWSRVRQAAVQDLSDLFFDLRGTLIGVSI